MERPGCPACGSTDWIAAANNGRPGHDHARRICACGAYWTVPCEVPGCELEAAQNRWARAQIRAVEAHLATGCDKPIHEEFAMRRVVCGECGWTRNFNDFYREAHP